MPVVSSSGMPSSVSAVRRRMAVRDPISFRSFWANLISFRVLGRAGKDDDHVLDLLLGRRRLLAG